MQEVRGFEFPLKGNIMIQPTTAREYVPVCDVKPPKFRTVLDAAHPWSVVSVLARNDRGFVPQPVLTYVGRHRR